MNLLLAKYAPYAALLALAGGLVGGFALHEREVGRLQVQLHSADSMSKAAQADARNWQAKAQIDSSRAAKLEQDTARANAKARSLAVSYAQTLPVLASTRRALDSAMQVAQQHPDSGSGAILDALRPYLAHSDSTIKACSDALSSEQDALKACQQQGAAVKLQLLDTQRIAVALAKDTLAKTLQIKAIRAETPGFLSTWGWRLAAFGLGIVAGHVGK